MFRTSFKHNMVNIVNQYIRFSVQIHLDSLKGQQRLSHGHSCVAFQALNFNLGLAGTKYFQLDFGNNN